MEYLFTYASVTHFSRWPQSCNGFFKQPGSGFGSRDPSETQTWSSSEKKIPERAARYLVPFQSYRVYGQLLASLPVYDKLFEPGFFGKICNYFNSSKDLKIKSRCKAKLLIYMMRGFTKPSGNLRFRKHLCTFFF